MNTKTIAVLTSGGDAPGMNAAVRAVVRTAISSGMKVLGVRRGYNGLLHGDFMEMNLRSVSDIIQDGGTTLFTARSPEFATPEGLQKAVNVCKTFQIHGVVVIGGDGSFQGARSLSQAGIPCIGIPGTIDNDIASSDYTIGFDTAMNTAVDMIDRAAGYHGIPRPVQCGGSHGSALRGYCHDDRYCRRRYCDFSAGIAF